MTIELFTVEWEYIKNNLEFSSMEDDVTEASIAYRIIDPKLVEDVNKYEQEIFYMAVRQLGIKAQDVANYEIKIVNTGIGFLIINMEIAPFSTKEMKRIGEKIIMDAKVKIFNRLQSDLQSVKQTISGDDTYGLADVVYPGIGYFEILERGEHYAKVEFNFGDYAVPAITEAIYAQNLTLTEPLLKDLEMFWINETGKTFTTFLLESVRDLRVADTSEYQGMVVAELSF